ncbi:Protein pitchfork [Frankliniella fusca]|uniref:Protein pitchfork n=1 Tax=Frankliniella fusca TaxID=407009 RepID=A0AAE1HPD2_9NEOP|nr:Protein pitchfork [Frankliniella fusca]
MTRDSKLLTRKLGSCFWSRHNRRENKIQLNMDASPAESTGNKVCPGHGVVFDDLPRAHIDHYLVALVFPPLLEETVSSSLPDFRHVKTFTKTATMTLNDASRVPRAISVPFKGIGVPVALRVEVGPTGPYQGDSRGSQDHEGPGPGPTAHEKGAGPQLPRLLGLPDDRRLRTPVDSFLSRHPAVTLVTTPRGSDTSVAYKRRRDATPCPEKARVAFGSAQSRAVLPLAGLKGGTSRLANLALRTTDALHRLGPGAYSADNLGALYDVLNKVTSKYGPCARTALRFRDVDQHLPAPNAYQQLDLGDQPAAPCAAAPFNTTTGRRALVSSDTPGPGSYSPGAFSLPGLPVTVVCGAGEGPGRCDGCLQDLPPGVEFWALEAGAAAVAGAGMQGQAPARGSLLCQACMLAARRQPRDLARFTRWQLDAFRKSRDCSDIHRHEGTKAKILLVDPKTVAKRRRKEAYLAKYFRDHTVVDPDYMPGTEPARLTEQDEQRVPIQDDFCCLHEAFNSFNKDQMSFGLRLPSDLIYNTMKRCALDFHPSLSSSLRTTAERSSSLRSAADVRRRSSTGPAPAPAPALQALMAAHRSARSATRAAAAASSPGQSRKGSASHVTGREDDAPSS